MTLAVLFHKAQSSIMKHLMEDDHQQSPNVSYGSSTSDISKYDQESGSNNTTSNDAAFSCNLPFGIDTTLVRRIIAEALGTFILVFCICGIIASTQIMGGQVGLLEYAVTAALTVIVVVFCIGAISGAHVNPAVTIAFATAGPFPWSKVPLYVLAQIVGSVVATYVGKLVYGIKSELMTTRPVHGCTSAFFVELIATFIVLLVACSLINEAEIVGPLAGLIVGAAIGLGVLITGPVSGGSMNPARSLGPAIVSWKFDDVWIYVIAPTAGAIAGAHTFRALCLHCKVTKCSISASPAATLSNPSHKVPVRT